jgi:uncharacterized protein YggT (Ycf19 family)
MKIRKAASFGLDPIRKFLPPNLPVDISPIVLIALLKALTALW